MSRSRLIWVDPGRSRLTLSSPEGWRGPDLGGGSHRATWWPALRGGMVVRWVRGKDEDAVLRALNAIPEGALRPTGKELEVPTGGLLLSGCEESLKIQIEPGAYFVDAGTLSPDEGTELRILRLRPQRKTALVR